MLSLEKHINLVNKIVWGFVKKNPGLEFDDLFSEACVAVLDARDKYDPEKGKTSTFIWTVVSNRLKRVLGQEARRNTHQQSVEEVYSDEICPGPEDLFIAEERWQMMLSDFSIGAQEVCSILFEEPDIYLPIHTPRNCRGKIARVLEDRGWAVGRIWDTFREIKEELAVS